MFMDGGSHQLPVFSTLALNPYLRLVPLGQRLYLSTFAQGEGSSQNTANVLNDGHQGKGNFKGLCLYQEQHISLSTPLPLKEVWRLRRKIILLRHFESTNPLQAHLHDRENSPESFVLTKCLQSPNPCLDKENV
jgi:hypothetical protein